MSGRTVEDEFEDHLRTAYRKAYHKDPSPQWFQALAMRAGTQGTVATLEEAGISIGVTRERLRQVFAKVAPHLRGVALARANLAAHKLAERSPVAEPIGAMLATIGLSRPALTGHAFRNLLALVGTSPTDLIGTDLVPVDDWLVEESEVPVMRAVSTARKHTSTFGMTTVEEIRQALATPENALDPDDINRLLRAEPTVRWAGDWLWVEKPGNSEHDNSMLNVVRQVLSVNAPQTLASIHEGVRRRFKFRKRDIVPPVDAMRVFLSEHPEFVVDGELVSSNVDLDYHALIGTEASAVIDVLKASEHQAMDWQSLSEACTDAGVNANSLTVWSSYAPWLQKVARRVFALRGSSPNPAAIDVIRKVAEQRSASEARRTEWTWSPSGRLELTMYVTSSLLGSGTFSGWGNLPDLLVGRDIPLTVEGTPTGYLKTSTAHRWVWGLGKTLTALDLSVGDVLRISIDVVGGTGSAERGGQELWA